MTSDEHRIVEFLKSTPDFVSVVKISLKVGGRKRSRTAPTWAQAALDHLCALGILETDSQGRFGFKREKVHLAPHIAEILARAKPV